MPQLVAWALVEYGAGLFVAGSIATAVVSYAIVVAAVYAYGSYQASQAKASARSAFNASLRDRLVMTATTNAPRSRLYGRIRNVDGIVYKATHGTKSEFYTFVVAIAGHEVDGFEQFWFNDLLLAVDGSGYVQTAPYALTKWDSNATDTGSSGITGSFTLAGTPVAGSVAVNAGNGGSGAEAVDASLPFTLAGNVVSWTGGTGYPVRINYQTSSVISKARIRPYTGAPGQDLSAPLMALGIPGITSAHKFQGIACLLVTLEFDTTAFAQGVPGMSAVVRGARVFDPRTGLTAWTENPALIARDWATYAYGGGASATEILDSTIITAANACDVTHAFVGPVVTTTRPLYTCGIVAPTQSDPTHVLNEIVSAMAGKYAWGGGILRIKAGAYAGPVTSIDETWLSGAASIDIQSGPSRLSLVNVYRPTIADAAKGYVMTPTVPMRADAYITSDGSEYPRDVTFLGVTDSDHARHVAAVLIRDARSGLTCKLPCNTKAYPLELFDVVSITLTRFGWAAKTFEVIGWSFVPTSGVELILKETTASIFNPDNLFPVIDETPNTNLPSPWLVPAPTNVAVTSGTTALTDGSMLTRTAVTWSFTDAATVSQAGRFEVQYRKVGDSPVGDWPSVTVGGDARSVVIAGLQTRIAYVFKVRAVNALDVRSTWSLQALHIIAPPPAFSVDWTNLPGRPALFHVVTNGGNLALIPPGPMSFSNGETNAQLGLGNTRSYTLHRVRRSDAVLTYSQTFDVYDVGAITAGRDAAALAAALNASTADHVVVVISYDEPQTNRLTGGLEAAMYRCGASRAVFGSPTFRTRAAYVLIGIAGCGEGNGFESYHGAFDNDPNAWVDVSFQLKGGNLIVTGSGATPGTLADYSYVGTLDATTDVALIARGNCVVAGNYGQKVGGTTAWDSDIYSRDSYTGGCFTSAMAVQTTANLMFGLNSDPLADSSYTSLDYAWFLSPGAILSAFESNVSTGLSMPYAVGDVLAIVYDGHTVTYMQNGVVRRTVAAAANLTLFFDSSFYTTPCALSNIRFGPLSAVTGIDTGQIASNAATDVVTTALSTHHLVITNLDPQFFETVLFSISYTNPTPSAISLEVSGSGSHRLDPGVGAVDVDGLTYLVASINGGAYSLLSSVMSPGYVTQPGFFARWDTACLKVIPLPASASITVQMRLYMSANPAGGPSNGFGTGTTVDSANMFLSMVAVKR